MRLVVSPPQAMPRRVEFCTYLDSARILSKLNKKYKHSNINIIFVWAYLFVCFKVPPPGLAIRTQTEGVKPRL